MVELSAERQGFGFNSMGENSATPSTVHVSLRRNEKNSSFNTEIVALNNFGLHSHSVKLLSNMYVSQNTGPWEPCAGGGWFKT